MQIQQYKLITQTQEMLEEADYYFNSSKGARLEMSSPYDIVYGRVHEENDDDFYYELTEEMCHHVPWSVSSKTFFKYFKEHHKDDTYLLNQI